MRLLRCSIVSCIYRIKKGFFFFYDFLILLRRREIEDCPRNCDSFHRANISHGKNVLLPLLSEVINEKYFTEIHLAGYQGQSVRLVVLSRFFFLFFFFLFENHNFSWPYSSGSGVDFLQSSYWIKISNNNVPSIISIGKKKKHLSLY